MRRALIPFAFLVCLLPPIAATAEDSAFNPQGRLAALYYAGEEMPLRTNLGFALEGWLSLSGLENASASQRTRQGNTDVWSGTIQSLQNQRASFRQEVTDEGGRTRIRLEVTAETNIPAEGLYFWIDAPRETFAGGNVALGAALTPLPLQKAAGRFFLEQQTAAFEFRSPASGPALRVQISPARPVLFQDRWERPGRVYRALIQLHAGAMRKGDTAAAEITLAVAGTPPSTPAALTLDAAKVRYRFHGIGGNYCFGIESPVTQYTLDNLNVAWGRTEMSAWAWEPVNDNDSPANTNYQYLATNDQPGSRLRAEMQLGRQLQDKGIPYCISIWRLPEWLYADPGAGPRKSRRTLAVGKWEELLENIGSYLVYARKTYGMEPDLFSFNEANIGIDVLLTAEEHRDQIRSMGEHFARLGLKTKMLLADATGPRGTHDFALPAAHDPAAMQYVGAVGFHSWGGATPEQYRAWGDLAEWLNLPLLVAELGVDAAAYRNRVYDSFRYGMREVRMYQEILLHARPQGTLQWEFTNDYGIARVVEESGSQRVVPTSRFWQVKHFANLTPRNSEALTTASNHDNVLFTAFRGAVEGRPVYTLHISNHGAARKATVQGIPAGVTSLKVVRTTESENYQEGPALTPSGGRLELDLPAASLVTLTTGAVK